MTRRWTIQRSAFFEAVRNSGVHHASWECVGVLWRDAFQWMTEQTAKRLGRPPSGHPPVWAWHSCGAWQSPPDVDDFHALYGLDPQPELELQIATLQATLLELRAEQILKIESTQAFFGSW